MEWTHGKFFWNELMTRDAEKAKRFYSDTIGWRFEAFSMDGEGTYWVANAGDEGVGGIFEMGGPDFEGVPDHWIGYLAVDDVDKRVKAAAGAGATIIREPFDIPQIGRIAILTDPVGGVIGWITPG